MIQRKKTIRVQVGPLGIGGDEPVRIQSMTNTSTDDVLGTVQQIKELVDAGSELVRITVNNEEAAQAVPAIKQSLNDAGYSVPLIGDFHFNGHLLLTKHPECAKSLDKYRINPGNVGRGEKRDEQFSTICSIARDNGKAVRIGVNGGSLDPELVARKMEESVQADTGKSSDEILNDCMVLSALQSTELALQAGLKKDQIILSCKVSEANALIQIYQDLSSKTDQPLHLGLTEAGMGSKGVVASAASMGILLREGIGDTIRVSLTPAPNGSRTEEVIVASELLQSLGIRSFNPSVTSCPGCGRTTSTVFQELASEVQGYLRSNMVKWKDEFEGVENLKLAVMGCIVNGPGESKSADIGISLPGTGEEPSAPVYVDGKQDIVLKGDKKKIATDFIELVEKYINSHYDKKSVS